MTTTVHSVLNRIAQKISAVMIRFLSYFEIWIPTLSINERQKLRQKAATNQTTAKGTTGGYAIQTNH